MPSLTSVFTDIANAIRTKAGVLTSYKPTEMADAIINLPSGTGESHLNMLYCGFSDSHTITISEAGIYGVIVACGAYGSCAASFSGATIITSQLVDLGDRLARCYIINAEQSGTITLTTSVSSWQGRVAAVVKISDFDTFTAIAASGVGDNVIQYIPPFTDDLYLIVGLAIGNTGLSNVGDYSIINKGSEVIRDVSDNSHILTVNIINGMDSPTFKYYGYDGGMGAYFAIKLS